MNYPSKSVFTVNRSGSQLSTEQMSDIKYIDVDDDEIEPIPADTTKCDEERSTSNHIEHSGTHHVNDSTTERVGVFDYFDKFSSSSKSTDSYYLGPHSSVKTVDAGVKKFVEARRMCDRSSAYSVGLCNDDILNANMLPNTSESWTTDYNEHVHKSNSQRYDDYELCCEFDGISSGDTNANDKQVEGSKVPPLFQSRGTRDRTPLFGTDLPCKPLEIPDWFDSDDKDKLAAKQDKSSYLNHQKYSLDNNVNDVTDTCTSALGRKVPQNCSWEGASRSGDSYRVPATSSRNTSTSTGRSSEFATVVTAATSVRCSTGVDTRVGFSLSSASSSSNTYSRLSSHADQSPWAPDAKWAARNGLQHVILSEDRNYVMNDADELGQQSDSDDGELSDHFDSNADAICKQESGTQVTDHQRSSLVGRPYNGSILCPQYNFRTDDDGAEDDVRRRTNGILERMQHRRQVRRSKQESSYSAAEIPGCRGDDSVDALIEFINAPAAKNDKKPNKKKKKSKSGEDKMANKDTGTRDAVTGAQMANSCELTLTASLEDEFHGTVTDSVAAENGVRRFDSEQAEQIGCGDPAAIETKPLLQSCVEMVAVGADEADPYNGDCSSVCDLPDKADVSFQDALRNIRGTIRAVDEDVAAVHAQVMEIEDYDEANLKVAIQSVVEEVMQSVAAESKPQAKRKSKSAKKVRKSTTGAAQKIDAVIVDKEVVSERSALPESEEVVSKGPVLHETREEVTETPALPESTEEVAERQAVDERKEVVAGGPVLAESAKYEKCNDDTEAKEEQKETITAQDSSVYISDSVASESDSQSFDIQSFLAAESDGVSDTGSMVDEQFITVQKKKRTKNAVVVEDHGPHKFNYTARAVDSKDGFQYKRPVVKSYEFFGSSATGISRSANNWSKSQPTTKQVEGSKDNLSIIDSSSTTSSRKPDNLPYIANTSRPLMPPCKSTNGSSASFAPESAAEVAVKSVKPCTFSNSVQSVNTSSGQMRKDSLTKHSVDNSSDVVNSGVVQGGVAAENSNLDPGNVSLKIPTVCVSDKSEWVQSDSSRHSLGCASEITKDVAAPSSHGETPDSFTHSRPESPKQVGNRSTVFLDTRKIAETTPPRTDISFGFDASNSPPENPPETHNSQPSFMPSVPTTNMCHCSVINPLSTVVQHPVFYVYPAIPGMAYPSLVAPYGRCTPIGVVPPMPVMASVASVPIESVMPSAEKIAYTAPEIKPAVPNVAFPPVMAYPSDAELSSTSPFDLFAAQSFLYREFDKVLESEMSCLPGQCLVIRYCDLEPECGQV